MNSYTPSHATVACHVKGRATIALGIRVNAVAPGAILTPLWHKLASVYSNPQTVYDRVETTIPLGRMGSSEDVANAVLFLASSESSFIQAAEIVVDGGATGAPMGAPIYR